MRKREPTHPGALLREEVLPALNVGKAEFARALGISRNQLYAVLNEEARVTPEIAVRLGKVCGNGPVVWLNMQSAHDLWRAERSVDVDALPTLDVA